MPIIVFQHDADNGPGRLGRILRDHAGKLDIRKLGSLAANDPRTGIPPAFDNVEGVISLGGGANVDEPHWWLQPEIEYLREAHKRQLPVVGICLGAELIAMALGGQVTKMAKPEFGFVETVQHVAANTDTILAGIPWTQPQFLAHGYEISTLPPGAMALQFSAMCKVHAFRVGLRTYAFQYHPELDRAGIDRIIATSGTEMAAAGLGGADLARQIQEHYDEFARLSDRLGTNLATYLFPITRGQRALSA